MTWFMNIASAKVSTSAEEGIDLGFIQVSDATTSNRKLLLKDAKEKALRLASSGYVQPSPNKNIKVHGRSAIAMFNAGIETMKQGGYITEYDQVIAKKLAYIMCGGDLTQETFVSEQYLLDLESDD